MSGLCWNIQQAIESMRILSKSERMLLIPRTICAQIVLVGYSYSAEWLVFECYRITQRVCLDEFPPYLSESAKSFETKRGTREVSKVALRYCCQSVATPHTDMSAWRCTDRAEFIVGSSGGDVSRSSCAAVLRADMSA